jgi:multidrug efflux pump subunit AcrB
LNDPQQINAVSEAILTTLPRGTEPPQIISYNAANVPVAQLNISSDTLSVLQLFDCAFNFLRLRLLKGPGLPDKKGKHVTRRRYRVSRYSPSSTKK